MTQYIIRDSALPDPVLSITAPPENNIVFHGGAAEMLKITEDGFYVRGKKVPVDEEEGLAVYRAFKQFLVHHALTKEW
jgi:hypothetical protein